MFMEIGTCRRCWGKNEIVVPNEDGDLVCQDKIICDEMVVEYRLRPTHRALVKDDRELEIQLGIGGA